MTALYLMQEAWENLRPFKELGFETVSVCLGGRDGGRTSWFCLKSGRRQVSFILGLGQGLCLCLGLEWGRRGGRMVTRSGPSPL